MNETPRPPVADAGREAMAVYDFLREPDTDGEFSLEHIVNWINRRPSQQAFSVTQAISDLTARAERAEAAAAGLREALSNYACPGRGACPAPWENGRCVLDDCGMIASDALAREPAPAVVAEGASSQIALPVLNVMLDDEIVEHNEAAEVGDIAIVQACDARITALRTAMTSLQRDADQAAACERSAAAERERIITELWHEAAVTPCEADAKVVRDCAWLVRCNFSYDDVEALQAAQDTPLLPFAAPCRATSNLSQTSAPDAGAQENGA